MHTTIDYNKSPALAFDAVQDIINYLGKAKYDDIAPQMAKVTSYGLFSNYCGLAGIHGFPVKAWYEHFHGQGTWDDSFKEQ